MRHRGAVAACRAIRTLRIMMMIAMMRMDRIMMHHAPMRQRIMMRRCAPKKICAEMRLVLAIIGEACILIGDASHRCGRKRKGWHHRSDFKSHRHSNGKSHRR
jgi:hypothetical protein